MTQPERISKGLWWDRAWSLVSGCSHCSPGCDNCWAAREAHMRAGQKNEKIQGRYASLTDCGKWTGEIRLIEKNLDLPLRVRKPTTWAIWNDLFHESVEDEFLDEALGVMLACKIFHNIPDHVFLALTKRPDRMQKYFSSPPVELIKRWAHAADGIAFTNDPNILFSETVYSATCHNWDKDGRNSSGSEYRPWGYLDKLWPLPNVWLGVTAENQEQADKRLPLLIKTPAAVKFVSVEPMLGPMDISIFLYSGWTEPPYDDIINLVICGGESGSKARPMHPEWVRSLRDQCQAAGTSFFFKQWGEWEPFYDRDKDDPDWQNVPEEKLGVCRLNLAGGQGFHGERVVYFRRAGKKKAGRLLDGRTWDQFPVMPGA